MWQVDFWLPLTKPPSQFSLSAVDLKHGAVKATYVESLCPAALFLSPLSAPL